MTGLNVSGKPVGDFNFELIKGDIQWLSRDFDSFLKIILKEDVNELRMAFASDRFCPLGQLLQRIQYLTYFLKVPYMNQALIVPQKVFPQAGPEQRSAFLLNLATLVIFVSTSAEYDFKNLSGLDALARDLKQFVLPDADALRFYWFHSTHVDLLTNVFVTTLISFRSANPTRNGGDNPNVLIDHVLEKVFGNYVIVPLFYQRKKDIHKLVKSEIYEKHLDLDAAIRLLLQAYPYSQFMKTLWNFIQKCYNHINAHPLLGKYASTLYDSKPSEVSDSRERKRKKTWHHHHYDVDSEDEIALLTYPKNVLEEPAMNQIPVSHLQPEDYFSVHEFLDSQNRQEIINSRQPYPTKYMNPLYLIFYPISNLYVVSNHASFTPSQQSSFHSLMSPWLTLKGYCQKMKGII
jgi:hypothetical protein